MFLRGYVGNELEGVADTYLIGRCEAGKQAVVIPLSPAQPMTGGIEGHAGDDGQFNLTIRFGREKRPHGFHNIIRPRAQGILALVKTQFQVVAYHNGQEHTMPCLKGHLKKGAHIHLVWQGIIQQYGGGYAPLSAMNDTAYNIFGHSSELFMGAETFLLTDIVTKGTFLFHTKSPSQRREGTV